MKRALFTVIMGLILLLTGSAEAANPAACAKACGAQYNMCLSRDPDFKSKCGTLPECQGVSDAAFDEYQAWFTACIDNPSLQCPQSCVPTQVTPPTPPTGTTTTPPRVTTPPRPAMSFKYRCETVEHGIYSKTTTIDANGAPVTREECFKLQDALTRIEALEKQVTELEKNKTPGAQADITQLINQLTQIRDGVNTATGEMRAVRERADKLIAQYNSLVERVNKLDEGQRTNTRDIAGIKGQLGSTEYGVRSTANDVRVSLPCWIAGYGEVQFYKLYDYLMVSEGLELGCRLFGTRELGFIAGLGGGFANKYFNHHLMEVHALFGLNAGLGENTDLLLTGAGKVFRSTNWERGTVSWYGLLSEIRYTFEQENPWFFGGRLGLGVINSAPPLPPDQMETSRPASHFDGNAWLMVGRSF